MSKRAVTLAEPQASGDRVGVVLRVSARGPRDPDREVLRLIETHVGRPDEVAEELVAGEDPDQAD